VKKKNYSSYSKGKLSGGNPRASGAISLNLLEDWGTRRKNENRSRIKINKVFVNAVIRRGGTKTCSPKARVRQN